ncbi:hypothetical protein LJR153_002001 [Paenibacillus sp. LjRoot153]
MPSINMQQFNKILKSYKKTEKKYKEISEVLENRDYDDSVVFEGLVYDLGSNVEETIKLKSSVSGMLDILKLNTEKDEKKYNEILKHLENVVPRRIEEYNGFIDELNKTTLSGSGYEHRKL